MTKEYFPTRWSDTRLGEIRVVDTIHTSHKRPTGVVCDVHANQPTPRSFQTPPADTYYYPRGSIRTADDDVTAGTHARQPNVRPVAHTGTQTRRRAGVVSVEPTTCGNGPAVGTTFRGRATRELTINSNGVDDGNSDPTRLVVRLLITLLTGPLGSTSTLVFMALLVGSVNCGRPGWHHCAPPSPPPPPPPPTSPTTSPPTTTTPPPAGRPALSKTILRSYVRVMYGTLAVYRVFIRPGRRERRLNVRLLRTQ